MQEFFGKKYKLSSSENFDAILNALGVSTATRKVGVSAQPVIELTEEDGYYTLTTTCNFQRDQVKFKPDEEFDELTFDGRNVKSIVTIDGNKMTHVQKGEKETVIEREFTPTEMKTVVKVDDVVCTRVYTVEN